MTSQEWAALWRAQEGRCWLCREPLPSERRHVHVDHDHSCCPPRTSCAFCRRGLACGGCNALIGHVADDPAKLRRIADNLEGGIILARVAIAAKPVQLELTAGG